MRSQANWPRSSTLANWMSRIKVRKNYPNAYCKALDIVPVHRPTAYLSAMQLLLDVAFL